MIGIYCIENLFNGKKYIGSSQNVFKRRNRHFSELKNNKHKNPHLQNAYNIYKQENLLFYVLEEVLDENKLLEREKHFIDICSNLYNINKIPNSSLGVKRTAETKEKVRNANIGLKHPEWRNKIKSVAQSGENHWTKRKKLSDKSKAKMSISQKKIYAEGYISPLKGKKMSLELIEKNRLKSSKKVLQFDSNNVFIKEWDSAKQASLFGFHAMYVGQCCNKKRLKYKNFIWRFKTK